MFKFFLGVFLTVFGAGVLFADPPKKRTFVGSLEVPEGRRAEVIRMLKEKGMAGVFVPEGAAPVTLLYRGTKAGYEAALDAVNRHLHPEWYAPNRP